MCGIIGIIGNKPACENTILCLDALQHGGIQSTGIIFYDSNNNRFNAPIRDIGFVEDVFYRKNRNILNRR